MIRQIKKAVKAREYSTREELWHAITHGLGAILSLVGLVLLVRKASLTHSLWDDFSFGIYGLSMIILFTVSTLYHAINSAKAKSTLQILDHIAIFLLIAGTYTPVTLLVIEDTIGNYVFVTVWIFALLGIILNIWYTGKYNFISTLIYLIMGWLAIIMIDPLLKSLPVRGLLFLFGGGIIYSTGVLFYLWERLPYNHTLWHIMVLLGSASHFLAIYWFV